MTTDVQNREVSLHSALAALHEDIFGVKATGPLAGVVVLDFGQAAVGPVAASYLAMLGALVIKIERPTGDHVRHVQPAMKGTSHTFIGNNLGQLGITLDLREPAERDIALELISAADVVVENFRGPEVMSRYALDYEHAAEVNPELIYLQSTAFGESGPLAGMRSNEWVTQAVGGFAIATGSEQLPEFSHTTTHLDWNGAMFNTLAVIAGLVQRQRQGRGFLIQTSQLGSTLFAGWPFWVNTATSKRRKGCGEISQIVLTSDDVWVAVSARTSDELAALERLIDPKVSAPSDLCAGEALRAAAQVSTSQGLLSRLRAAGIPSCQFDPSARILDRLLADPKLREGGLLLPLDTPWGPIISAAPHWSFDRTPARIPGPSPKLGQHNSAVLGLVTSHLAERPRPTQTSPLLSVGAAPLAGVRLLVHGDDPVTSLCGCILEDLGADPYVVADVGGDFVNGSGECLWNDVISSGLANRVERWTVEDDPATPEQWGELLRRTDVALIGESAAKSAASVSDELLTEDFKGVCCRVSGWGPQPLDPDLPASELTIQVLTGMNRFVGTPQGTGGLGYPMVTVSTALSAVQAVLAALFYSGTTGVGQRAEVSMVGAALAVSQWNIVGESGPPDLPVGRQLEAYDWPADHGFRLIDRWCLIDLREDEAGWLQFFVALGRSDLLQDERFNNIESLQRHRILLPSVLAAELARTSFADMERFVRDELGGTIVPILSPVEAANHVQSQGLGVVLKSPTGERGLGLPLSLRTVSSIDNRSASTTGSEVDPIGKE